MNKLTHYLIVSIAALVGLSFITSCEDFLNKPMTTKPTKTYYNSAQGFNAAVNAVYESLRIIYPGEPYALDFGGHSGEAASALTVFGTDTYTHGSDGGWKGFNNYDQRLNASAAILRVYWKTCYQAINQANSVIAKASAEIPDLSNEIKTKRIAEVRFLRALFYFDLVRQFGPVTLKLKPTKGELAKPTRTSVQEVYTKAIIPDLQFAIEHLPAKQADFGRATKPAAQMLLAKVFLTRGYTDFAQPNDFSKAASLAEAVIQNYDFELLDNFIEVFDIQNQKNKEVIWSVQYIDDLQLNGGGNGSHLYFLMGYDILPGMTRDIENGRPWIRYKPTEFLLGLWNRKIDNRYDASFKTVFYANNLATIPTNSSGKPYFSVGDTAVYLPGHEVSAAFEQSKHYMIIEPDEYTRRLFPSLTKVMEPTRATVNQTEGVRNWIVMRLSGTYLIAAEAYLQMGNKVKAAQALNVVRRRAAKTGKEDAIEISPSDVTLDFILDERARELVGEMHRWFALKRTQTLIERVRAHNRDAAPNIQEYHRLRPIPQEQLDRSKSFGSDYGQNPGY